MQLCFFITQNYYCTVRILPIKVTEMRANILAPVACIDPVLSYLMRAGSKTNLFQ